MIRFEEKFNQYYKSLEEDFIPPSARQSHYDKHNKNFIPPFTSPREYEINANKFASQYVNAESAFDEDAHLVGYIAENNVHVLYDRWTKELAMFIPNLKDETNPNIITFYVDTNEVSDIKFKNLRDGKSHKDNCSFVREFPHIAKKQEKEKAEEEIRQKALELQRKKEAGKKKHDKRFGKKK